MPENETKKSPLGEKLARIARGAPVSMGFAATSGQPVASLALVVKVDPRASAVAAAAQAQVDAIMVDPGVRSGDDPNLADLKAAAPGIPLGALANTGNGPSLCEGADFCVAAVGAPASILHGKPAGLYLAADLRYSPILMRGLAGLDTEGILIENARAESAGLTVEDLLRYRVVADLVPKPLIAVVGRFLGPDDMVQLRDAGIEGALLDLSGVPDADIGQQVEPYSVAIEKLGTPPQKTRRAVSGRVPALPSLGSSSSMEAEPDEEPDEDE